MLLYSLGLLAALLFASPYWLLRMLRGSRYRHGLAQRLGFVPRELSALAAGRRTLWLHAVSVGEVIASTQLVKFLDELDAETQVVISTTTQTGQQLAQKRFATRDARVFYYPLDFAWSVRRYLRVLQPRAVVLMESELWPRMIWEAWRARIPIIVVNGRISDRSLPRYRALRWFWRPFFRKLALVMAQSEEDARRFVEIGVPSAIVQNAGNLKYDVRLVEEACITKTLRTHLPSGARVLVAGSTLEGEESKLLEAFTALRACQPNSVLILAPRHPQRFSAVESLVRTAGLPYDLRSRWMENPISIHAGSVFLLDSIGELTSVYALASLAFIGGSLVPAGGHNPLEPAQFGVPIAMGPHGENFRDIIDALRQQEAIHICKPELLTDTLHSSLEATPATIAMGQRARAVFEQQTGASQRCLHVIQQMLSEEELRA